MYKDFYALFNYSICSKYHLKNTRECGALVPRIRTINHVSVLSSNSSPAGNGTACSHLNWFIWEKTLSVSSYTLSYFYAGSVYHDIHLHGTQVPCIPFPKRDPLSQYPLSRYTVRPYQPSSPPSLVHIFTFLRQAIYFLVPSLLPTSQRRNSSHDRMTVLYFFYLHFHFSVI